MKKNELRLGNYFNYEQTTHIICSLNKDNFGSTWLKSKADYKDVYYHSYDELKPIPITEEWYYKIDKQLSDIGLQYSHSEITNRLCIYLGIITVQCKYVHHIQNLYFSLTEKELNV